MKTTLLPAGHFVRMLYFFRQRKAVFLKHFLVGFLAFGFAISGVAQYSPTSNWSLFQKNTGINFYAKLADCPRNAGYDRSNVLIKIENTTDFSFSVDYHVDLFLAGKCSTCGDAESENTFHFSLKPKEVLFGTCDMKKPGLSLFADWLEPEIERVEFSGFDLSKLQVNQLVQEDISSRNPFKNMETAQLILTIHSLRKEIIAFEKKSASESNGWYRVTYDKLMLAIEEQIDKMEQDLVPMKNFVLPGGHQTVSFCHIARCVCRRAERTVIDLSEETEVSGLIIIYLNRLSDYLFVLSRKFSAELKAIETPWKPRKENNS